MSGLIFGYTWEEIQSMQQRTYRRPVLNITGCPIAQAKDSDYDLLAVHGPEGLKEQRMMGVIDRLTHAETHKNGTCQFV